MRHEHCIDVDFAKKGCQRVNSWWEANLRRLVDLALVARFDIPLDIAVEQWPPETVGEGAACGVVTLVTEAVVGVVDEGEAEGRCNIKLVSPVMLQPPKPVVG